MKKLSPFLFLICWSCEDTNETESTITFVKYFDYSNQTYGKYVQQTTDGGYVIAGSKDGDFLLIKTDYKGDDEWYKIFGIQGTGDYANCVQQTQDGGYIIVGSTESSGSGNRDVWLIKTDIQGSEEWNKTFGGSDDDGGYSVQQTTDGGYIISGETRSFGSGNSDAWVIKTNSQGQEVWNKTYGNAGYDYSYSGEQTTDGGYIICYFNTNFPDYTNYLLKIDSEGNEVWNKTIGSVATNNILYSVQQTNDGSYIMTGFHTSASTSERNVWLVKTNSQGDVDWSQMGVVGTGKDTKQTQDGGFITTGYEYPNVLLHKTNSQGQIEWSKSYIGDGNNYGESVQETEDGGYIITGYTDCCGGWHAFLIKTDNYGNTEL